MPSNLTEALKHLTTTFGVKDIMTTEVRLTCASDVESAPGVSAANPDFSVIPIKKDGLLYAYFERDSRRVSSIVVADLISDGTSLLELVDILQGRNSPRRQSRHREATPR